MQQGFSLLEVLVTLFIISVGLLGFVDAEINAMRELKLLQQYAFLTEALFSLDETLQTADDKALAINDWQKQLKANFSQANITVTSKLSYYTVVIQWPQNAKAHHFEETLYA